MNRSVWDGHADLSIERIRGDAEEVIEAAQGLRRLWQQRPVTADPEAAAWMQRIFDALARIEADL